MDATPLITANSLTKYYPVPKRHMDLLLHPFRRRLVLALRRVSFCVYKSEVLGVVGPNGSGKTTILKILAGLVLPTEGEIYVDGRAITGQTVASGSPIILAVMDERSFYRRLTVRQNLMFFAALNGRFGRKSHTMVRRIVEQLNMKPYENRPFGSCSAGMRQMACLARALLGEPAVLLLDEPTKGLDLSTADMVSRLIRDTLVKRLGVTVIMASHSVEEVRHICDRALCVKEGEVQAVIPPVDPNLPSYM